jgi:tetratricopeptide (TPR) repeat protein
MTFTKIPRFSGKTTAGILISIQFLYLIPCLPAFSQQSSAPGDLGKIKSTAATQHEIVMLLINKKEFEKALNEANKIFDLNWPENQEPLLLKELQNLSDQFRRQGQAALGLQLVDRNFRYFKKKSSQIEIFKEKGFLYKSLGQDEKALEFFQKARDLEGR